METLAAYIQRLSKEPFSYGTADCCIILADWWLMNTGIDPVPELRGVYSDAEECSQLLLTSGGVLGLVTRVCQRIGAVPTLAPKAGDFGVIAFGGITCGSIKTLSGRWFVKTKHGAGAIGGCVVLAAWRIESKKRS